MTCLFSPAFSHALVASVPAGDPFLWLEKRKAPRALRWARNETRKTLQILQSDWRYERFRQDALAITNAQDDIPKVSLGRRGLDNFTQDKKHVRGIWRRTTLDSYRTKEPQWETILDVDALAPKEKKNWVFNHTDTRCLQPEERLCLVKLFDGGREAAFVREFDQDMKAFVKTGFNLPEGKQDVDWVDRDTILVARDWGKGTMTRAGHPFVLKEVKRSQPLAQAREVFRGERTDYRVEPFVLRDNEGAVHATGAIRVTSRDEREYILLGPKGPIKLRLPKRAEIGGITAGRLLVKLDNDLDEDWAPFGGAGFRAGSIISYDLAEWKRDPLHARPSLVFQPGPRQELRGFHISKSLLILTVLDNLQGKAFTYKYDRGTWRVTSIALPENADVSLLTASDTSDRVVFTVSNYLKPTSLWYFDAETEHLESLKVARESFNASLVEQFEATSRDGTRIPYFLVRPRNARLDGSLPTLLYGYGGFGLPELPSYDGVMGRLWLEQGNAYVVAHLRGGGGLGRHWHEAAQGASKQRTWEDAIAVAEDLIRRKVTSPGRLGVFGASQGGLLVGTALTQRPDLFNAAIAQVPLFDMLRFTKLTLGALWRGEYGDPAIPDQREWIQRYSPYQKLVPGRTYPAPFILSATNDDIVHPAHGRKAAARLRALGQPYFYYEDFNGGHGPATPIESARQDALIYIYAHRRLVDGG
ncbi:S9 family peptidase [Bradyrhizobium sp. IC4060]|nr:MULTISPECIES: prolyl oligopeptidase family serine peptidase [unclassified Bradyrhizobium]MCA1378798.1 S9 family peptidase [Bradyrhizobium sp. IC4060]MCA1486527.1 S9 family peptidase [Bradyrhizobium sp. IC4061]